MWRCSMKNLFLYLTITLVSINTLHPQNFWQGVVGPTGTVNHYAINSTGYIFIVGGCGALRSTDDGESWTGVQPSDFGEISITINSSDHVFVGTYGDGIYKSTNNGGSWTQINNGLTNLYVYSLATHQNDDIYAGLYLDVCKSTNNGNSWSPTNLAATFIVTMDINSGGVIFAGANLLGIYKSTDNGATWNICNNGLTTANIFTLSISSNDDIYLGTVNGGAFRSTDEGNSWMQIGLTGYEVRCFAFAPNGDVYSGTNDGVFKSTDNGGSWTHLSSSGLNNPYVHCLFFNSVGYLFAGTGISLCRSVEPVITSVDDSFSETPQSFLLFQNYPNPFNPSTTIQYAISSRQFVTLKIYNILGKEIATLVNEEKQTGIYEMTWNAENLPSGIYFYQLRAGNFIQTRKMLLLK
jgi:photosystem II stability/assembly factor-like uncharacterized protein